MMTVENAQRNLDAALEDLARCDARLHSAERTGMAKGRLKELRDAQAQAAHAVQECETALARAREESERARREAEEICSTAPGRLADLQRQLEAVDGEILAVLSMLRSHFEKSFALAVAGDRVARDFDHASKVLGRNPGGVTGPTTRLVHAHSTFKDFLSRLIFHLQYGTIEFRDDGCHWFKMDASPTRPWPQSPPLPPAKKPLTVEEIRSSMENAFPKSGLLP